MDPGDGVEGSFFLKEKETENRPLSPLRKESRLIKLVSTASRKVKFTISASGFAMISPKPSTL